MLNARAVTMMVIESAIGIAAFTFTELAFEAIAEPAIPESG